VGTGLPCPCLRFVFRLFLRHFLSLNFPLLFLLGILLPSLPLLPRFPVAFAISAALRLNESSEVGLVSRDIVLDVAAAMAVLEMEATV
jgi:hypothetical protein